MKFAQDTKVAVSRSRAEIEQMLSRYGVSGFTSGWVDDRAAIVFEKDSRRIRFELKLPRVEEFETSDGRKRPPKEACEIEHRRLWRALALVIKAKLESVESGIETLESAFLSQIVVPSSGKTIGEWIAPKIADAYDRGVAMPPMLGSGS